METFKVLSLSTCHVTKGVGEALDEMSGQGEFSDWRTWLVFSPWSYGWWLWVDAEDGFDELPICLQQSFTFAKSQGCRWIQFDCDSPQVTELTTYDW